MTNGPRAIQFAYTRAIGSRVGEGEIAKILLARLFMIASALALVPRLFVSALRESCNDIKPRRTIYYLAIVDSISSFASSSIIESISRSIRASFGALTRGFSVMTVAISAIVGASNI